MKKDQATTMIEEIFSTASSMVKGSVEGLLPEHEFTPTMCYNVAAQLFANAVIIRSQNFDAKNAQEFENHILASGAAMILAFTRYLSNGESSKEEVEEMMCLFFAYVCKLLDEKYIGKSSFELEKGKPVHKPFDFAELLNKLPS